jgi:hypothetical protein
MTARVWAWAISLPILSGCAESHQTLATDASVPVDARSNLDAALDAGPAPICPGDPVCTCERQPERGEPCEAEGASCGQCCPQPGEWPLMTCEGGTWQPGGCPPVICPPPLCPADLRTAIGQPCSSEGQSCGNGCCGTAFECRAGAWRESEPLDCICEPGSAQPCGTGQCNLDQICQTDCGPDDGIVYSCASAFGNCGSCDCITPPDGHTCVEENGRIFFSAGPCG